MGDLAAGATSPARAARMVGGQVVHALRELARDPTVAVVSLGLPLMFLVVSGLALGDQFTDPGTGEQSMHRVAASAAAFAAAIAAYVMLPFTVALARERGVLKRLRGTPLPAAAYFTGRVVAAQSVGIAGTALMLGAAVAAFDLEWRWTAVPGLVLSLVVGVTALVALGFAVLALMGSSQTVMAFTMGSLMLIAFVSELFGLASGMPRWLDVTAWMLPLRHLATALTEALEPGGGIVLAPGHLAALAAWGVGGAAVALSRFRWDPPTASARGSVSGRARRANARPSPGSGRSAAGLVWEQVRHANRAVWRDPASAFFALVFPALFVVVVPVAFGDPLIDGAPMSTWMTPSMMVFAVAVTAYVNTPESVAIARETGVLKRLRGTPLPAWAYLAGRLGSAAWLSALGALVVLASGWLLHDVTIPASAAGPLALAIAAGIACLAALGLALVALTPSAKAVPAVALGSLLPLAFISDVFAFGAAFPDWLTTIATFFPLRHLSHAATDGLAGTITWKPFAVMGAWTVAGALAALLRWHWTTDP